MFTLCIENGTSNRYLIGFQEGGIANSPVKVNRLFDDDFGEIEDCDILLVDDPKRYGQSEVLHHRCQLVSYLNQPTTNEDDWVRFLEKKKLRVAWDNDLRLIIHVEQKGCVNFAFLAAYLAHRKMKCPYSQVFIFGQAADCPRKWFCALLYPELVRLPDLDEEIAKNLVLDREQYNAASLTR